MYECISVTARLLIPLSRTSCGKKKQKKREYCKIQKNCPSEGTPLPWKVIISYIKHNAHMIKNKVTNKVLKSSFVQIQDN